MAFGSIPAAHILLPSMKQKPAPRRADEPKKYIERSKQVPARQSGGSFGLRNIDRLSLQCRQSDRSVSSWPWIVERVVVLAYIQQMRDNDSTGLDHAVGAKTPGFTAMGIFLFFGSITASLAATTLLWPGTVLDRVWALNPVAYKQLAPLGGTVGLLFLLLGAILATSGIGWFRRRLWGWRLAVVIIAT